ncbi:ATPase [Paenibacillus sp. IB182496]|uniref:ATPase n=1 Tax=Paenibacillus sabuli TaxID=2772509 RepID=A0A927BXD5_9BACL|nr:BadF/BadG/BcrA/BcrD ATPase family protein [Paenibacillus sabuli]MBD2847641.1 ATPase [Paenibacillus sabuli]
MLYLGIDAGGTKTDALLVDASGTVRGRGRGGCGNHQLSVELARASIAEACEAALREAGAMRSDVAYAYFGLAGADREPDYAVLRPLVGALGYRRHAIACDTMIGMRAGTRLPYGAAIVSGTGFNAAARNRHGEELQYGGFGYVYGDGLGTGKDLANHALRTAIRSWQGREAPSLLCELVPDALGHATMEAMYDALLDGDVRPPAELAKLMFEAAAQGDPPAIAVLEAEGAEHANAVGALIRRLGMQDEAFDVVLIGSVLMRGGSPHMVEAIRTGVAAVAPAARVVKLTADPVVGAALCALESAGEKVDEALEQRLRQSAAVE